MRIDLRGNSASAALEQVVVGIAFLAFYGILIRQVGAAQVGVLSLVLTLSSVGALASGGIGSAIARLAPLYEGNKDRRSTVIAIETTLLCSLALYVLVLGLAYFPLQALLLSQVGPAKAGLVKAMMPATALYVLLMGLSAATTLSLTALQRSDLRLWASVAGAMACLAGVWLLVPRYGVQAAVWSLAMQVTITLGLTWMQLRRILPELAWLPWRCRPDIIRQVVGMGANLQAQTLLIAALEPIARLTIGHFGVLADVTFFSMASRFIIQVRALVFAGAQPLLSAFSFLSETNTTEVRELFERANLIIGFTSLLALSAAAGAAPFVGEIWIGQRNSLFVVSTLLLAAGWAINTLVLASYFFAYARNQMTWNLLAHVLMLGVSVGLGALLASRLGAVGVVAGIAAGLAVSGLVMGIGNAAIAPLPIPWRTHILFGACATVAVALAILTYDQLRPICGTWLSGIGSGLAWAAIMLPAAWLHPARPLIVAIFKTGAARPAA